MGSRASAGRARNVAHSASAAWPTGGEPASEVAGVVGAVGCLEQRVQLGEALHARDRHEVAAEAADLALHAALLVRAARVLCISTVLSSALVYPEPRRCGQQ